MIISNARIKCKVSTVAGVIPTVPIVSNHLEAGWQFDTDIYEGEFFLNIPDETVYTRAGDVIIQLAGSVFSASFAGMTDVNLTGLVDGQTIIWDSGVSKWIPGDTYWYPGSTGLKSLRRKNGTALDATADYALSTGFETQSTGVASFSEGYGTTASGASSHAEGISTEASGDGAHAEGSSNVSSGNDSHTEGASNTASGNGSHAEGSANHASGLNSHAEGGSNVSAGELSHSEGKLVKTNGLASHCENIGNVEYGYANHLEGSQNIISNELFWPDNIDVLNGIVTLPVALGDVTGSFTIGEYVYFGHTVYEYGFSYFQITDVQFVTDHTEVTLDGDLLDIYNNGEWNMFTVNTSTTATANHAEGHNCSIQGNVNGAHVEGFQTVASANFAHAEGKLNKSNSEASHTEGFNNVASGYAAHAEGNSNTASGDTSHAEGNNNTSSGTGSHAEGSENVVSGAYSHVSGTFSDVSGDCATGIGERANASIDGMYAHGHGQSVGAEATYKCQYARLGLRCWTNNENENEMLGFNFTRLNVLTNSAYNFSFKANATDKDGNVAMYTGYGVIKNVGGTVSFSVAPVITTLCDEITVPGIAVYADDVNKALKFTATGLVTTEIGWSVSVEWNEITF